jgi:hypothetical protein
VPETPEQAHERGRRDGATAAQLREHAEHLDKINGQIGQFASQMADMVLALQGLTHTIEANARTVIVTAAALEQQRVQRQQAAESKWSPLVRISLAIGVVAGLAAIIGAVIAISKL